ncbi:MAG: glycogen synthase [Deltaproteobacteria bacterium RIFOXYD12_FULL_55_16]|nr:MAG: glycogen synthase [Deltaproteobacteria bacterium RIFOXYD12_FULL_55_16]
MSIATPRKATIKNVWMLTREYDGLAGAGGVKDVARQLAEALARSGRKVSVVLPLYGFIDPKQLGFTPLELAFEIDLDYAAEPRREYVRIFARHEKPAARRGALAIYLIDAARYLEKKSVYTYTAEDEALDPFHHQGSGHFDYFAMNVLLQKAAAALMIRLGERPEIIHCHDGHTAILPAILRESEGFRHYFAKTGCVLTIHNAGIGYHQEVADLPFAEAITGLPGALISNNLLDEKFDPLLAASPYATMNTVSENYARELRETDDDVLTGWLGHRLLARGVVLKGVTNGINPADFDPTRPKTLGLAAAFNPANSDLAGKAECRQSLLKDLARHKLKTVRQTGSLENRPDTPLFTFVGRLSSQKGVDKLLGALETLLPLDQNFQVLIQGSGSRDIEEALAGLAASPKNQGRICLLRGYDQQLANRIYAAGDFFLIPSRYEPCGLTDYIAQLFGNLPIVHHIGGLVKVQDGETGFSYPEHKSAALMGAMQTALQTFRSNPKKIQAMQQAAVRMIYDTYTWDKVLAHYLSLYREALSQVQ